MPVKFITTRSKKMRWEEHVACMGENINAYRALVQTTERSRSLSGPNIDERIILKCVL
jgi:hypothetical protein